MHSPRRSTALSVAVAILFGAIGQSLRCETPATPTFSNSPTETNFALEARTAGESKAASLATEERSKVKLDFIPGDERTRRAHRGFPSLTAPKGAYGVEGHGSQRNIFSRDGEPMTEKELAEWIRKDERYEEGMTVYLLC